MNSHISICLGTTDEDRSHGNLSREYEDDQALNRCKFFATLGKIWMLTKNIQELTTPIPGQPQVWCIECYTEGNLANECTRMRGMELPHNLMGPSLGLKRGVVQVSVTPPFHTPRIYNTISGTQTSQTTDYCDMFWTHGHVSRQCPIMQKYTVVPNKIHYDLCASTTHDTNQCRALGSIV
jgi:hypothetical protein